MNQILKIIEQLIGKVSEAIWPIFLPILLIIGLYIGIKMIFYVKNQVSTKAEVHFKNIIGPASISLGAMIGTGAIIGVIGSLSKLNASGQMYIEALAIWACIGAIVLVPVSYAETLVCKVMKMPPHHYIKKLSFKSLGTIYVIGFIILYIFGIGGFQFSGIDTALTVISSNIFNIDLNKTEQYIYIIIPIIIFVGGIVLTKKHDLFINAMTLMITVAVAIYIIFFIIFIFNTREHLNIYFHNLQLGLTNPVIMGFGIPTGLVLGLQRVIQTAETGIGALGMASLEANSKPREAAFITLIPTILTIFIAIVITSYITSYGITNNIIEFGPDTTEQTRLIGFFKTTLDGAGFFGIIVMISFTILSGLTTLLGSYYFLDTLTDINVNFQIFIYLLLLLISGTLAIFGFTIVFDLVDLLLFLVTIINVYAIAKFVKKYYKHYLINKEVE